MFVQDGRENSLLLHFDGIDKMGAFPFSFPFTFEKIKKKSQHFFVKCYLYITCNCNVTLFFFI